MTLPQWSSLVTDQDVKSWSGRDGCFWCWQPVGAAHIDVLGSECLALTMRRSARHAMIARAHLISNKPGASGRVMELFQGFRDRWWAELEKDGQYSRQAVIDNIAVLRPDYEAMYAKKEG